MNKIFKVIWSKSKQCYVVVSEIAKNKTGKKKIVVAGIFAALAMVGTMQHAQAVDGPGRREGWPSGGAENGYAKYIGTAFDPKKGLVVGPNMGNNDTTRANGNVATVAIGAHSNATGSSSVAIGGAVVNGAGAIGLGWSTANGDNSVALGGTGSTIANGNNAFAASGGNANGESATAIGSSAIADGRGGVAVGWNAESKVNAVGIGFNAKAKANNTIAIGVEANNDKANAISNNYSSVSIGVATRARAVGSMAMGVSADASGKYSIALGSGNVSGDYTATANYPKATGEKAIAIGYDGQALNINATAVGSEAHATGNQSAAYGFKSQASEQDATAIGSNAIASAVRTTALGVNAQALGSNSVAIGGGAGGTNVVGFAEELKADGGDITRLNRNINIATTAEGDNAVALGYYANAANGGVAIGQTSIAATGGVALGQRVLEDTGNKYASAVVIGQDSTAKGTYSVSLGRQTITKGSTSLAMGNGASANGDYSVAMGRKVVADDTSTAIGHHAYASKGGLAIGAQDNDISADRTTASAKGALAIGKNTKASAEDAVAIGTNAQSTLKGAVALGSGSTTATTATKQTSTTVNGIAYNFAGATSDPNMQVSVGAAGKERQIKNVAAGEVSATSTDAINGSQLFAVASQIKPIQYFAVNSSVAGNKDNSGATGSDSVAIGPNAKAQAVSSIALGNNATAAGGNSIAIGNTSSATDKQSPISIGYGATANGDFSVAIGGGDNNTNYGATANGVGGTALGGKTKTTGGNFQTAVGYGATTTAKNASAFGYNATTSVEGGVALGFNSFSTTGVNKGYNPNDNRTNKYDGLKNNVLTSTTGAIAVGNGSTVTRQITGVAAGTNDTDAVNVAQLKSVNLAFKGNVGSGDVNLATNDSDKKLTIQGDRTYITTNASGNTLTISANKKDINVTNGTARADAGVADAKNVAEAINKAVSQNAYNWYLTADNDTAGSRATINKEGTVKFSGDSNITVSRNGNTITTSLNKAITVDSVKANKTITVGTNKITLDGNTGAVTGKAFNGDSFTAGNNVLSNTTLQIGSPTGGNNVSITRDGLTAKAGTKTVKFGTNGINAGDQQINNVASAGGVSTNAANYGDVKNAVSGVTLKINDGKPGSKDSTVNLSDQTLVVKGGTGIQTSVIGQTITVKLDNNTENATTKGIGIKGDSGFATKKYLKDGDAIFNVTGDGNLVKTSSTTTGVQVSVNSAKVKDLAVDAVTVSKATNIPDNPITVTPKAGTNSKEYAIGIDTTKLAAKTNLAYKANGATAKSVSLAKGLNFVNGTNTVSSVDSDGKVSFDLNQAIKDSINKSATAVGRTITLNADSGTGSSQSLSNGNVSFAVSGATGDYISTTMDGSAVKVSTKRATIDSDANTGKASVTGADGLATAKNVASAINSAVNGLSQNLNISDGTNNSSVALKSQKLTVTGTGAAKATVNGQTITIDVAEGTLTPNTTNGTVTGTTGVAKATEVAAAINNTNTVLGNKITKNTQDIATNTSNITANKNQITTNTTNIATNTANIAHTIALADDAGASTTAKSLKDGNVSFNIKGDNKFISTAASGNDVTLTVNEQAIKDAAKSASSFKVKANTHAAEDVKGGDTIAFNNGDNIEISQTGKTFTIKTAKNITVDSVTAGNTVINTSGLTNGTTAITGTGITTDKVTVGGISIDKTTGINAGGKVISNVASGTVNNNATDDSNAANIGDVKQAVANLSQNLNITDGTNNGTVDLKTQKLNVVGANGVTATVNNQTITVGLDTNTVNATTKGIGLTADTGSTGNKYLKDGDVSFVVTGDGNLVSTSATAAGVKVAVDTAKVKDLAVAAVTVSKDAQADNPITVTPTAGTNSKDYAIGIDTTKLAAKTDLTYRANSAADANAKKVSLSKGLDFVDGGSTVATVDNDGKVSFDLNTVTKNQINTNTTDIATNKGKIATNTTNIAANTTALARNISLGADTGTASSQSLSTSDVAFNVKGATGDFVSTNMNGNTVEISTKRATINSNATTGEASVTGNDGLATAKNVSDAINKAAEAAKAGAAWNITTNSSTTDKTAVKGGDTVDLVNGDNIEITQDGTDKKKITVATKKDISVDSVTANNKVTVGSGANKITLDGTDGSVTGKAFTGTTFTGTSFTAGNTVINTSGLTNGTTAITGTGVTTDKLTVGGISVDKTDGINAGGKVISNVASGGTTDSNAANIGDVKQAVANLSQNLNITDGTNNGTIDLKNQKLNVAGANGVTATVKDQTITVGLDANTINATTKGIGLTGDTGSTGNKYLKDGDVSFAVTGDGSLVSTTATAAGVKVAVDAAKVKDLAVSAVTVSKDVQADNPITVTPTAGTNSKDYAIGIDTTKLAAKTDLTYRANSVADANAKKVSLSKGLDFVNGTLTTASVDNDGVVKYDVNTAAITAGADGTITGPTTDGVATAKNVADAINAAKKASKTEITANTGEAANATTGNVTLTSTTAADGHTIYDVKLNDKVTLGSGTNAVTIDGTAGKATIGASVIDGVNNTLTTGGAKAVTLNGTTGTITGTTANIGGVTVNGTTNDITGLSNTTVTAADFATKGRAATEEQLKAATGATTLKFTGDVATNTGSVNLKDDTFGIKGDNKYISTDVNGKNVNLTVSEAEVKKSAVAAVTVSTDTTDTNNPLTVTPTTSADGTTKDYKVTIDGTKIANKTNLSYKANDGTAKQVSLADGLNFKNGTLTTASIDDAGVVKYDVNTASITAGTDGTITGPTTDGVATAKNVADAINAAKKASKTEITANTGEAANATTGNVTLTSTTAADGHTIYDVKLNDKVTLGTGANAVTVDGTTGAITGKTATIGSVTVNGTANTIGGLSNTTWNGTATTGRAATEDQLKAVADAASSQTWNITADKAGTTGAQTGTKKNATVGKDETVELVAGDNLTINQDERKFTYSLNKDLAGLTSVSIGTGTTETIKLDGATGKITAKNAVIGGVTVDGDNNHVTGLANTTWNGTATTGRAATEDQLKAVAETAKTTTDAVNLKFSGNTNTSPGVVNLKDDTLGIVGDGKYVSTDANGKNLTVKVSEAEVKKSAVAAVTVSTDTTDANNPLTVTPTTSADGTTKDYKVTIDGTKIANKTNLSYKANGGTAKQVSLADGLNFKNGTLTTASIDDNGVVKYDVNTASITAGADGTITGPTTDGVATAQNVADAINAAKKASKTEITANTGEAANATTGNVTLTSTTAADGHTIYDVKLNDKVTLGSGANAVTIDGTAGKATIGSSVINGVNNTFTTGGAKAVTLDGATGTITGTTANIGGVTVNGTANTIGGLSNTTWNGTATTGRAATEDQLKAVADAAGSQTWEITADKKAGTSGAQTGTKENAKVGKDDKVSLIAGENLTVDQAGKNFTYSLNKDLVKMNSATFEVTGGKTTVIKGDSIVQTDGTKVNTSTAGGNTVLDGIKSTETTATGQVIKDGVKTNTSTVDENTLVDGAKSNKTTVDSNVIDDGNGNVNTSIATSNTITDGTNTSTITAGKGQIGSVGIDGIASKITTGGANAVVINGADGTIKTGTVTVTGGTTNDITGLSNTTVTAADFATKGRAATEEQLKAVGEQTWQITADKDATTSGAQTGTKKDAKVGKDDKVQLIAGENMTVNQNERDFTFTLNKNLVKMNSATFLGTGSNTTVITGNSITQTAGSQTNISTAGGNTVADGTKSTETTADGQVIKDGAKSNKSTVDSNVIDDGNGNVNTSNATSNTITDGTNTSTITAGKATIGSSIVDGVNNTFTTGGANAVKLDGAAGTIKTGTVTVTGGTTNDIIGLSNTTVTAADFATKGRAATEEQLKAVGEQTWQITADKDATTSGAQTGTKKDAKVGKDDKVQLIAGENMTVNQNERDFTFTLNKDLVKMNSATFLGTGTNKTVITGDSITQTAGTQTNTSTAAGNTVVDGTKSTETTATGQVIKDGAKTNTSIVDENTLVDGTKSNKTTVDSNVIDDGNGNVNTSNATSNTITDGTNTSTITAGKATIGSSIVDGVNNTFTTGGANAVKLDGAAGTIKTGTVTVTGGTTNDITGLSNTTVTATDFATKGRAATEEQLKAVGEQTWQITADKDATTSGAQTGTKKDAKVGKDDKVQLIAGENMTVNQNERDFTFTLNKDLVKMNSATFLGTGTNKTVITGDSITQTAGTQTNTSTAAANTVANGTKSTETTADGQVIKDGTKSNKSTVDSNVIDDGNGNVNTSNATSNTITDGTNTSTITAGKATIGSSIVDGVNNTFTTGGANAVKLDGAAGTIKTGTVTVTGGTTNDITGLSNTTVTAADFATKGRAATEEQLKAVGEQTWQITADKDATTSGAQTGTKKNAKVGKDDKVQLIAGENLTVNQNERDFTYSLNKDLVKMNSATFLGTGTNKTVITGDSITQTAGTQTNTSTVGGNTVADGTKSTETTADGQVIKDGAKSNKSTVDSNVIDDGNGKVNTSNATSNTITDGTNTSTITAGKATIGSSIVDGVNNTFTTGGANAVKLDGAAGTIKTGTVTVTGGTTNDITGLSNTTVTSADFATKGRAATEEQLKAVGEQTWQITADKDATTSGAQTGTKKDAKVGKNDKVQLIAGENMTVNQNERDFTFTLNKDLVKMNSATFEATGGKTTVIKGDSIVQTDGTKVNTSTAGGNTVVDGTKSTATTADGTTVTSANGNTKYAADGVRINTTGKNPVSLTDAGLDNGNNVIKNVASGHVNNDATDNTNAANIADVKKATTTVTANAGEAANATKGNVTLTSTTAADGHTIYDVKLNDKVTLGAGANAVTIDGTSGKATIGSSVIDGVNNTFTTGGANAVKLDGAAGTIKAGTVTVTGGTTNDITGLSNTTVTAADFATKGRAATEEQLKAVGEQTWQITADKDATTSGAQTGTKKDAKVGKDDKVQLIAGENLTVNQNERDFIYSLNKDLVKMNSATFLGTGTNKTVITGDSITQTAGTQMNTSTAAGNTVVDGTKSTATTADGTTITNGANSTATTAMGTTVTSANGNTKYASDGVRINTTGKNPVLLTDAGLDNGNNVIKNVASGHVNNDATDNTNAANIADVKKATTTVTANAGEAANATKGNVTLTSTTAADGHTIYDVKLNDKVILGTGANAVTIDGTAGKATIGSSIVDGVNNTFTTGGANAVKLDGVAGTIKTGTVTVTGGTTNDITGLSNTTVTAGDFATKGRAATEEQLKAVGEQTWQITADKDAATSGAQTGTKKDAKVGKDDKVQLIAGENMTVNQNERDFTFTLNKDLVKMNSATFEATGGKTTVIKGDSIVQTAGTQTNTSTAAGNTVADGTKSTETTAAGQVIKDGTKTNTSTVDENTLVDGTKSNKSTVDSNVIDDGNGNVNTSNATSNTITDGTNASTITAGKATIGTAVIDGLNNAITTGGTNSIKLDGAAGTVTGLTNKTWTPGVTKAVSGRAATEDQLQIVADKVGAGWNVNSGKVTGSTGEANGSAKTNVASGEEVQLQAGNNLIIDQNGKTLAYSLNKNLKDMESATFNATGGKTTVIKGDSIVQTDGGKTNTSNAAGNTVIDGTKTTATTAAGTTITDGANTNTSTATSNTLKNAAGDETKVDAKGATVKDAAGNTTNVASTGATVTNAAGDTTKVEATGTTVTDTAGNKATFTKDGVTITKPGKDTVSLTGNGLDNGNNKIVNVADGTAAKDAVNVSQLNAKTKAATTELTANGGQGANNTTGNIVLTKTTAADGHTIYDNKLNDKITLGAADPTKAITVDGIAGTITAGKDGNAVAIDGTNGTVKAGDGKNAVAIDGVNGSVKVADKVTLNGKDGKAGIGTVGIDGKDGIITTGGTNPIAVNGKDGVVTGLTNKAWDPNNITSGRAATEDQIKSAVANAGWNAAVGSEGSGVNSTPTATAEKINPNETVTFKAGNNMMVSQVGKTISYAVNPELTDMKSATFKDAAGNTTVTNGNGMTITPGSANPNNPNAGPVSLTKDGLHNGNNQIKGVAPGTDPTDAVNVSQLNASNTNTSQAINQVAGEVQRVGAHAAAMAALKPIQYDPLEPTQVMAGVGNYRGETAAALGLAHYTNENTMFNIGVSVGGNHNMVNAGVTHKFGYSPEKKNIPDRYKAGPISSVYVMQDEVSSLKKENAEQKYVIADQAARLNSLEAENERQRRELAETKQGLDDLRAAVDKLLASKG